MSRAYVVVLNWNGWADTIVCLESLLCQSAENYRIVVCDNASTDGSMDRLTTWARGQVIDNYLPEYPPGIVCKRAETPIDHVVYDRSTAEKGGDSERDATITFVHTGGNLGFAGGNNVGLRYALARGDGSHFWLLNNDTYADRSALKELLLRTHGQPDVGMVGSTLRYFDRPNIVQAHGGATFQPLLSRARPIGEGELHRDLAPAESRVIEQKLGYVIGASMLVSRRFVEAVGLMQEDYFLYYEELDWATRGRRCRSNRFTMAFAPRSVVFHKVGASAGSRVRSLSSLRYMYRNELRFMKRFYPALVPVTRSTLLVSALRAMFRGRPSEGRLLAEIALGRSEA